MPQYLLLQQNTKKERQVLFNTEGPSLLKKARDFKKIKWTEKNPLFHFGGGIHEEPVNKNDQKWSISFLKLNMP